MLRIGAHLSNAKGIDRTKDHALNLGANACQIFTSSPKMWNIGVGVKYPAQEASKDIEVVAHATYLLNIASLDENIRDKSWKALESECKRCNELNIKYLVIHAGSSKGGDRNIAMKNIVNAIQYIHKTFEGNYPCILIENSVKSKEGGKLAVSIEDYIEIFSDFDKNINVGACIDLGHVFLSGVDIREARIFNRFFSNVNDALNGRKIHVIHVTDTYYGLGSNKDVHANLGKGEMGLDFLRHIFSCKYIKNAIKILETPDDTLYKEEISYLKNLYINKNKK